MKRESQAPDASSLSDSDRESPSSKEKDSCDLPTGDALIARIREVSSFLEAVRDNYSDLAAVPLEVREALVKAAGQVARPGPWAKRQLASEARRRHDAEKKERDRTRLNKTGIRQSRRQQVFSPWQHGGLIDRTDANKIIPHQLAEAVTAPAGEAVSPPAPEQLEDEVHCYICKESYRELHFFYDSLCPRCAETNWAKRTPTGDLSGRVAVVTGSRVKIGYHAALMLLRAGAHVVVTTRFARDAAKRYAAEKDFESWSNRLEIFGLDLRHTPSVEDFTKHLCEHLPRLDFLINNACQTVRRPVGFYDHLLNPEQEPLHALPSVQQDWLRAYEGMRTDNQLPGKQGSKALVAAAGAIGLRDPAALSQLALLEEDLDRSTHLFPAGQLDADLQQVDKRTVNSWRLPLAEVSAVELLEVQLVNAVAPFILNARLKPLMLRHATKDKHIVNVSAVEGQFSRRLKTDKHPHTNMAKAALNMMTRTSAADYVRDGIHMNSVDTGWVTDEDPLVHAERKVRDHDFHPPLDIVDGAARIVDPIFEGLRTGRHCWGAFLKDYRPVPW